MNLKLWQLSKIAALTLLLLGASAAPSLSQTPAPGRALGTIKSLSLNVIVLSVEAGGEITVTLDPTTKLVRIAPGEKDLKNAQPLVFSDLQVGDRILVRGAASADGKGIQAASVIAMKQVDIAKKQASDREEWNRHGVGGIVKSADPGGMIVITTNAVGPNKEVTIHTTSQTIVRRYAPDSVKFDDAKPAPVTDIHPGDQLRARGSRAADGVTFTADEIVSGSFRNISGTVVSVDAATGTLTIHDLAEKKDVAVHVTSQSQLRSLPLPLAQRLAARLKGEAPSAGAAPNGAAPNSGAAPGGTGAMSPPPGANGGFRPGAQAGGAGAPNGGNGDLQQMIARLPAVSLGDLQKGAAVMLVATEGSAAAPATAVTLLSGVEPLLQASPKGAQDMILSPWSLGGGGGAAEAGGAENP